MAKTLIIVFLISMVPIIELRGAIPYGILSMYAGMNVVDALKYHTPEVLLIFLVAIVGNMIPVPFIYLFARKILEWGSDKKLLGKPFTWILRKGEKAGEKINQGKTGFIGLMLFIGIPLPGTGAWTGTLAASILHMRFRDSIFAAIGGVLMAGVIMLVLSLTGINIF